ncbi:MAG: hypothetical protein AAF721_33040, partial [Myxococcota bacterium]
MRSIALLVTASLCGACFNPSLNGEEDESGETGGGGETGDGGPTGATGDAPADPTGDPPGDPTGDSGTGGVNPDPTMDGSSGVADSDPASESGPVGDASTTGEATSAGSASGSTSGDPATGTTGSQMACDGANELTLVAFAEVACAEADAWSCEAEAPGCESITCDDPMGQGLGWIRAHEGYDAEQAVEYASAVELAPPQEPGSWASANFFFDLNGLCNPVFRTWVACGQEQGCDG